MSLLFTFLIDIRHLYRETVFYTFQIRDIYRAWDLLNGQMIFFGPEMTGGGNLPGPLYYFFMAASFLINPHWFSAWVLQYLLAVLAMLFGFEFFKKKFNELTAFFWIILFATAPFTFWFLKVFLNVSSLLLFVVLSLIFISRTFSDEFYEDRRLSFVKACFFLGIGLQFHLSIIFLFFAFCWLLAKAKRFEQPEIHQQDYKWGALIFLLPSLPYLIWLLLKQIDIEIGGPTFYVGESSQTLESIFFLIKEVSKDSWKTILTLSLQKFFFTVPFAMLPILFVFFITESFKSFWQANRVLLICLLFSFLPYLNWYFSPQAIRYTMLFYVCLLFLTTKLFQEILNDEKKLSLFNEVALYFQIVFILICFFYFSDAYAKNAFAVFFSLLFCSLLMVRKNSKRLSRMIPGSGMAIFLFLSLLCSQQMNTETFDFKYKDRTKYMPTQVEWDHIWSTIYQNTGWSYEQAKDKIFFIGHHMSQSPELAYMAFDKKKALAKTNSIPDGFIVSNRFFSLANKQTRQSFLGHFNGWLNRQNIPKEFLNALDDKSVVLGENLSHEVLIVPYFVKDPLKFPRHFHNIAEGYRRTLDDEVLDKLKKSEGVKKLNSGDFLFKWTDCLVQDAFCANGALVRLNKLSHNQFKAEVKIVGSSLSQISPWISPNWTQVWLSPFLEITCGKELLHFDIISSIGFSRELTHLRRSAFFLGNNSILAPMTREFAFECSSPLTQLSVGRKGSKVDQIVRVMTLPAAKLTYTFTPGDK